MSIGHPKTPTDICLYSWLCIVCICDCACWGGVPIAWGCSDFSLGKYSTWNSHRQHSYFTSMHFISLKFKVIVLLSRAAQQLFGWETFWLLTLDFETKDKPLIGTRHFENCLTTLSIVEVQRRKTQRRKTQRRKMLQRKMHTFLQSRRTSTGDNFFLRHCDCVSY